MYSLSTSWNYRNHKDGHGLIEEIKSLGFDAVELNFALTEDIVNDILSLKENSQIKVSSLHNICPIPKDVEQDEATPDYYSLASSDEGERKLAVEAAKNTIRYAAKFSAMAVVLHTGRVQIKDMTRDLAGILDDKAFSALKAEMISARREKANGYLDNALKSLNELAGFAQAMNVSLGIENRYYYREIPLPEELDVIFKTFKDRRLYYWHDVGHAEVFERLGLGRHRDLLHKHANRLLGIHLHDIMGLLDDHRPPGLGTFDFRILKPYITKDTIKVLEVHQPASAQQVRKSAGHLRDILG